MAYDAKAIANYFLELAKQQGKTIDPMGIQKFVYFAHGWSLGLFGKPLIDDLIEAWDYGPVIRSLYKEFREFGNGPITRLARNYEIKDGKIVNVRVPSIDDYKDYRDHEGIKSLLSRVLEVHKGLSSIQLSNITHESGSPWSIARSQGKEVIDDELMRSYFSTLAGRT